MHFHRFPRNKACFLEYWPVLPLTCRYAAITRKIELTSLKSIQMSMARSLRDSIQLAAAAGVKEQWRIVYLKTVLISRHDGERAPQNLYYDYWAQPVDDRYL